MANFRLPNGATLHIASGLGAAKAISAFSNANPGVMTLEAAHGIATGELFVVNNGWSRTNGRAFKAGTVATNDVPVADLDTQSTARFPSGGGVGTVREITGWNQIIGVINFASEGGEQQYTTVQELEAEDETRLPTNRSAQGLNISVGDDTSLPWYATAKAASESGDATVLRLLLKNGNFILYNGILTLNETPSTTVNQVMALSMSFSLSGRPVRYAS
ncbi:MAG TPA: phage tail protein [Steroidobacter sp.]|uniref:phage tail protein n=1 Tax=Steroidobacter sp. TaxID=1978227 RepID=UPI002EDAA2EA